MRGKRKILLAVKGRAHEGEETDRDATMEQPESKEETKAKGKDDRQMMEAQQSRTKSRRDDKGAAVEKENSIDMGGLQKQSKENDERMSENRHS